MKKGFVCGSWDLLHAGHILLLEECAKRCDHLLIGLHVNPAIEREYKTKPVQSIYERFLQLRGCKYVDGIVLYETEKELETILRSNNLDIRFLGSDYDRLDTHKKVTANEAVPIEIIDRHHDYSSTELKERIKNE